MVREGIEEIRSFLIESGDPDSLESSDELLTLEEWEDEIQRKYPACARENLLDQIQTAVAMERYEQAAILRNRLLGLN